MKISHTAPKFDKAQLDTLNPTVVLAFLQVVQVAVAGKSLSAMVIALLPALRHLGIVILRTVIEDRDNYADLQGIAYGCPCCKSPLVRTRHVRPIRRYTLLGLLTYNRRNYLCGNCKRSEYPTDWALDVLQRLHGHSQEFASLAVLMTTLMPNAKAMNLFHKCFGFAVSTHLVREMSFGVGTELVAQESERAAKLWAMRTEDPEKIEPVPAVLKKMARIKRVYVMADDSKLGIQEGNRGRGAKKRVGDQSVEEKALRKLLQQEKAKAAKAAKAGKPGPNAPAKKMEAPKEAEVSDYRNVRALLIFEEKDRAQVSKGRAEILRRKVIAHIGTLDEWRQFVHMAMVEYGVYTAQEVFVIADGGTGIWEMFEELLPTTRERKVIQVLDFYHASCHLWAAGRAYRGHQTAEQRKACILWVKSQLAALRAGQVSNVIQRLGKLKAAGAAAEEIAKAKKYFETHRRRMRYAWLREQNALIGSGAMESVHAWVIQARCRLPGMRWSVAGANAMLRLRCAWASDAWDENFARAARAPTRAVFKSLTALV